MNDDWDPAEGLDPEGPSADDLHRFGDEMDRCNACGREVYDQAEVCPYCGGLTRPIAPRAPFWPILVAVVLVAVIVVVWVIL